MSTITPEILHVLGQKSHECAIDRNSWDGLAIIMHYLHEAVQRVPTPAELQATDTQAIDRLFTIEIEHLAIMLSDIFEGEGFEELAYYLPNPVKTAS
jgi:hypothetical protein